MAFFDQIGKKITDAGQGVAKQTRDMTDTTRLNAKISGNKKKMSSLLFEMGSDYYKKHRKDLNCEEQAYIDQLNVLFREIMEWQNEIEAIKNSETCKICGSRIVAGETFCMNCGARVGADALADVGDGFNRTCPSCGAPVEEGSAFCMACGAKLDAGTNPSGRICPACGAEAEEDDTFCMACGAKL